MSNNAAKSKRKGKKARGVNDHGFTMSTPSGGSTASVEAFTLNIPLEVYETLLFVRQNVHPYEFAFEGVVNVDKREKNAFRLEKIYIPPQEASTSMVQYEVPISMVGTDEEMQYLALHGHSHAGMDAFWSQVDIDDINDWMGPYRINLVMNNYGKLLARIDFFTDIFGENIRISHVDMRVKIDFPSEFEASHVQYLDCIHRQENPFPGRSTGGYAGTCPYGFVHPCDVYSQQDDGLYPYDEVWPTPYRTTGVMQGKVGDAYANSAASVAETTNLTDEDGYGVDESYYIGDESNYLGYPSEMYCPLVSTDEEVE